MAKNQSAITPFQIKGKVNTALCFAKAAEKEAVEQIRRMCDFEFTAGSRIRIMPDVHAGKGCTIGTTMTVTDKVVPNVVGVDIGCGMYTINLGGAEIEMKEMDAASHFIPSGMNVWNRPQEDFDFTELRCFPGLKNLEHLRCSLGTLGGGNHFIEIDRSAGGTKYLVIHSGSRNLGKQVAEYYQKKAIELNADPEGYSGKRDALIAEYKAAGRSDEIESALKALKSGKGETAIPDDLCFVYGEVLNDYLRDVELCQRFARRNREKMAEIILGFLNLEGRDAFHTIHNYIDTREMILRKGAIAAHRGERVLIPVNMRDGSILAEGKGNPDWNFSAPHGAGRIMSRSAAKRCLDMREYRRQMAGIYSTSVSAATLDEAPMAYKSLSDIIDTVRESVGIIEILKPVYNFKAN